MGMMQAIRQKMNDCNGRTVANHDNIEKMLKRCEKDTTTWTAERDRLAKIIRQKLDADAIKNKAEFGRLETKYREALMNVSRLSQTRLVLDEAREKCVSNLGHDPRIVRAKKGSNRGKP